MFTVVEPGGLHAAYVSGAFRQRNVEKISEASAIRKTGYQDSHQGSPKDSASPSRQSTGPSAFQARLYEHVESLPRSSRANIFARDIMSSPVITLPLTASLSQVWKVVHSTRFRHILILKDHTALGGILSDRDLLRGAMEPVGVKTRRFVPARIDSAIQPLVSHPVLVALRTPNFVRLPACCWKSALVLCLYFLKMETGMITRSDILRVMAAHPEFDQWA